MDPETGKIVVVTITIFGALAWLAGLTAILRVSREQRNSAIQASERFAINPDSALNTIVGEAEVEGEPEELSTKLASQLAKESFGPFGPLKIVVRNRHEVAFEPAGKSPVGFKGGRLRLQSAGSRTRIDYAIETSSGGILIMGWVMLALGLAAVIGIPWLIFTYVLSNPNPNVQGQVFQAFQMVHFLWPPFLVAHLARQPSRMLRAHMVALVYNLPYT